MGLWIHPQKNDRPRGTENYPVFQFWYETIYSVTIKCRMTSGKVLTSPSIKRSSNHVTFLNFVGSHFSGRYPHYFYTTCWMSVLVLSTKLLCGNVENELNQIPYWIHEIKINLKSALDRMNVYRRLCSSNPTCLKCYQGRLISNHIGTVVFLSSTWHLTKDMAWWGDTFQIG